MGAERYSPVRIGQRSTERVRNTRRFELVGKLAGNLSGVHRFGSVAGRDGAPLTRPTWLQSPLPEDLRIPPLDENPGAHGARPMPPDRPQLTARFVPWAKVLGMTPPRPPLPRVANEQLQIRLQENVAFEKRAWPDRNEILLQPPLLHLRDRKHYRSTSANSGSWLTGGRSLTGTG